MLVIKIIFHEKTQIAANNSIKPLSFYSYLLEKDASIIFILIASVGKPTKTKN